MPMPSEREQMLAGELYDPQDPDLQQARARARGLCETLNGSGLADDHRRQLLGELFAAGGDTVTLCAPFYCDYGCNLYLGEGVFFNYNCVVLDACEVRIGAHTLFGPAVQIYTPLHPLEASLRRTHEFAQPVTIGADVWVGGAAVICPGVTIGDRAVIGAGSVVTRDIPAGVLAVGNPLPRGPRVAVLKRPSVAGADALRRWARDPSVRQRRSTGPGHSGKTTAERAGRIRSAARAVAGW